MEQTRIICAASVENSVPDHAASRGTGWLTAEYGLLPYSTERRTSRPLVKRDGRAVEIQRLIGRCLRGVIDLSLIPGYTITLDCDVLQADGGTRTAAITGAYIALNQAVNRMLTKGLIRKYPLTGQVAAVSVGYVDDELLIDLDYSEDSKAEVDLNIIMDGGKKLIEVQGTGEKRSFTSKELNEMLDLASAGIESLLEIQNNYR